MIIMIYGIPATSVELGKYWAAPGSFGRMGDSDPPAGNAFRHHFSTMNIVGGGGRRLLNAIHWLLCRCTL